MPIIINELVFKGTIAAPSSDQGERPSTQPRSAMDQEMLVQVCVEEVLKVLERQKER